MSNHDCPGLNECLTHPRWHVFRDCMSTHWWAASAYRVKLLPTYAAAITYADRQAQKGLTP